ncbi:MAG: DUF4468 domain-containing protein [Bacteroidales bacterium]|nr:DUF4468 domain-containing protein [Bacteroidales bacterium]
MKKTLLFTLSIVLFIVVKAQVPVDSDTKLITYQDVVDEAGIKDTLYNRGITWVNTYFKNPANVFRTRDPEKGEFSGRHRIRMVDTDEEGVEMNSNTIVDFAFKIECKENRYRYTIDDFTMKAQSKYPLERWLDKEDPTYLTKYDDYLSQVNTHVLGLIADIKEGMKKKEVLEDNW